MGDVPSDPDSIISQFQTIKEIQKRYPGDMVFLDAEYGTNPDKAAFNKKLDAIATSLGIELPDVIIVKPPLDKAGKPKPQKPDASVGWLIDGDKFHHVVFVTEYLKNGLNDTELLGVLAHEMGHVSQYQKNGHNAKATGKSMESDADRLALACPEVDPAAYKAMLLKVDKLTDAAAKQHPLLYGDFTGSTALIPASIQTKLAFGGNHPMTSTRVKMAEEEIQRRAEVYACAAEAIKQSDIRLPVIDLNGHDSFASPSSACALGDKGSKASQKH